MTDIYTQIKQEREYQKTKWALADANYNTPFHFAAYIGAYTNRSLIGFPDLPPEKVEAFKKDMIKVATLAIAAVESL